MTGFKENAASLTAGSDATLGAVTADSLTFGSADTDGVRLDLESGVLAVREGDDSAYAGMTAAQVVVKSSGSTGVVLSEASDTLSIKPGNVEKWQFLGSETRIAKNHYVGWSSSATPSSAVTAVGSVGGVVTLTDAATILFTVALPAEARAGGTADVMLEATDGTDHQVRVETIRWACVNKAGVYTTSIQTISNAEDAIAASSGTLTATYDATTGTDVVNFRVTPTGSLTETTYQARVLVHNLSAQTVTIA